ncbi:hypothetical protein Lal_00012937 [Lupinus albus]|nr:hypothetical protein Lal_00012937 [Lupinus albus]
MFVFGASFGSKSQAMEPLTLKKRSIRCLKLGKRKIRENERIRDNEDGNCGWCVYGIENECLGYHCPLLNLNGFNFQLLYFLANIVSEYPRSYISNCNWTSAIKEKNERKKNSLIHGGRKAGLIKETSSTTSSTKEGFVRKGLRRCPLTLKILSVDSLEISTAP